MTLVERLVIVSNAHGYQLPIIMDEGWTAFPVNVEVVQRSPVTCGVWVLAQIAAVLRGYHVTGISENGISLFRDILYQLVLVQPCIQV